MYIIKDNKLNVYYAYDIYNGFARSTMFARSTRFRSIREAKRFIRLNKLKEVVIVKVKG